MLSYEEYVKLNHPDFYEFMFVHKKTPIEILSEIYKDQYSCPVCGSNFVFKVDTVCAGHGEYYPCAWLECSCGILVKKMCISETSDIDKFLSYIEKFKRKEI